MAFCLWLLSLSMFSRFVYVVACVSVPLLNNIPLYGYTAFYPFISWWTGLLPPFGYCATVDIYVQVFLWVYVFDSSLGYAPRNRIAVSVIALTFGGTAWLFSKVAIPFHISIRVCKCCTFSSFSSTFAVIWLFHYSDTSVYEVVSHHGFDLCFPDD